jgi:iron complex outermembrane receptor protein
MKINYSNLLITFLLLLFSSKINAEIFNGSLTGKVIDAEANTPIPNAVLQIAESEIYYTTNDLGEFQFHKLNEVKYTLIVTHVAYQEKRVDINLSEKSDRNIIIYLLPKIIEIAPVVVTDLHSHSKFDEYNESFNVLKGKELQKELGLTLASTLKNETGLAIRSMGPAPARPVIRGLGGDRVHIAEDGVEVTDLSSTSPDHAVTIEPFSLERIEVVRGPKVLLHTSTTIGGVVNAIGHEIPQEYSNKISGAIGGYGETANKGFLGSFSTSIPINNFIVKGEMSRRKTDDISTPVGTLGNSDISNLSYNFGTSYISDFGFVGGSFKRYELDYGVPGGFVGAHPFGVKIKMLRKQYNIKSRVEFDNSLLKNIEFNFSNVYYRHKEFEFGGLLGAEFEITNYTGNLNFNHHTLLFFDAGTIGTSVEYRDYNIGGFVFNPPTKSLNVAAYLFESINFNKLSIELGARTDFSNIEPEYEKPDAKIGYIRKRNFSSVSASLSVLYEWTDIVHIGANLSRSSRIPTIEELFTEGPHLAAYSYETGNPNLGIETGIGSDFFLYHRWSNIYFNLNLFYNDLSSYIIPRNSGETNFQTLLPIYTTDDVGAKLYGSELQIEWEFLKNLKFNSSSSYTHGKIKDTGNPLPQIPPLKGRVEIVYSTDDYSFGVSTDFADKQTRLDEFEKPTAGYTVLNSFFNYSFSTSFLVHSVSLNVDNIFDKEYRNHLSRVKIIMPEAGRNIRLSYKLFYSY